MSEQKKHKKILGLIIVSLMLPFMFTGMFNTTNLTEALSNCASNKYTTGESATGALTCAQIDISQITGNIINSITVGVNTLVGALTFSATSPLTISNSGNTITYACSACLTSSNGVASISNTDGTLTISPTLGNVIASLNLGNANTWTAAQTFNTQLQIINNVGIWWKDNGGTFRQWLTVDTNNNLVLGNSNGAGENNIIPNSDNTFAFGSTSNRILDVIFGRNLDLRCVVNDANPCIRISSSGLQFGIGGVNALDLSLKRVNTIFNNPSLLFQTIGSIASANVVIAPSGVSTDAEIDILRTGATSLTSNAEYLRIGSDIGNTGFWNIITGSSGTGITRPIVFSNSNGATLFGLSPSGIRNTQGEQSIVNGALTNPSSSTTFTLPIAESDTLYAITCTPNFSTTVPIYVTGKTATQFTVNYASISVNGDTVDCIITHQ